VGLSFTEAGPPELFWLPGVPVSGVNFVGLSFTEAGPPELFIRRQGLRSYSGFPESRSPELRAYGARPSEVILVSRSPGLRSYSRFPGVRFPESRSPELVLPGVPVSGVRFPGVPVSGVSLRSYILGFPESRSPELGTESRSPELGKKPPKGLFVCLFI